VLGWIAERLPHLVREIQERGHEIAYHGYNHELPNKMSTDNLKQDLEHGKKMLEDVIGKFVNGYRAPSFAINEAVLDMIKETGYLRG
jgi:peptidoglycan/xylan/chitin deacetylase (PgdA/CDA1 family)